MPLKISAGVENANRDASLSPNGAGIFHLRARPQNCETVPDGRTGAPQSIGNGKRRFAGPGQFEQPAIILFRPGRILFRIAPAQP
jgi:hypothetical protein